MRQGSGSLLTCFSSSHSDNGAAGVVIQRDGLHGYAWCNMRQASLLTCFGSSHSKDGAAGVAMQRDGVDGHA